MIDTTVMLGVGMFTATVLSLVLVILFARSRLVNAGNVTIQINDERAIRIVIDEAERRGINYRGGRQIAAAIIKEWAALQDGSKSKFNIVTKEA